MDEINLQELFAKYPTTPLSWCENEVWRWKKRYIDCTKEEREKANHRGIFPNEIVIDIDNPADYEPVKEAIKKKGFKYYAYKTGGRGYHINLFFTNMDVLTPNHRNMLRKYFFACMRFDKNLQHKTSENTLLAKEGMSNRRTGALKTIVEAEKGENLLQSDLIAQTLKMLENYESRKLLLKDEFFESYHLVDPFFQFITNTKIPDGMQRNDVVFKNVAIALVKEGLDANEIRQIIKPIIDTNFPGKSLAEFEGWVTKAMEGGFSDYNTSELNLWGKKYWNREFYDLTPISINISVSPAIQTTRKIFYSDKELAEEGDVKVEWTIDKWIPKGDICFLAGKAASFKTTIALHMVYAISQGKPVFNTYLTRPSKVLYVNEENYRVLFKGIVKRIKAGLDLQDAKLDNVFCSIMENLRLDNQADVTALVNFIKKNGIEVVVFDSFRRFFIGEENDAGAINTIFNTLKYIRKECGDITIIILHHAKKDNQNGATDIRDMLRGSSDIVNMADSVIGVKRHAGKPAFVIEHIKNRAGEELVGKLVRIESGENNDMAYFYETAVEIDRERVLSQPEVCANEILKWCEDTHTQTFKKGDLVTINSKYNEKMVYQALKILVQEGTLNQVGSNKGSTYVLNPNSTNNSSSNNVTQLTLT